MGDHKLILTVEGEGFIRGSIICPDTGADRPCALLSPRGAEALRVLKEDKGESFGDEDLYERSDACWVQHWVAAEGIIDVLQGEHTFPPIPVEWDNEGGAEDGSLIVLLGTVDMQDPTQVVVEALTRSAAFVTGPDEDTSGAHLAAADVVRSLREVGLLA